MVCFLFVGMCLVVVSGLARMCVSCERLHHARKFFLHCNNQPPTLWHTSGWTTHLPPGPIHRALHRPVVQGRIPERATWQRCHVQCGESSCQILQSASLFRCNGAEMQFGRHRLRCKLRRCRRAPLQMAIA